MELREKHLAMLRSIPDAELREEVEQAMEQFPDRLRQIRKNSRLTLRDTGAGTGIKWQMISAYERGENMPDFKNICLLARYYGVTVDWLMGGEWN